MARQFSKTVFVVGAGASREFLLPTGRELLTKLADTAKYVEIPGGSRFESKPRSFRDEFELAENIIYEKHGNGFQGFLFKAAAWISRVCRLAPSIDNLLHAHSENKDRVIAGKMMIAHSILVAEKESSLRPINKLGVDNRDFLFNKVAVMEHGVRNVIEPIPSWLAELFWILVENQTFQEFLAALKNMTFIVFNYDRCVEHFLLNATSVYFDLDTTKLNMVSDALNVVHPYGSLGRLTINGVFAEGFGTSLPIHQVYEEIRTFTEGIESEDMTNQIKEAMTEANILCFLGFGYLDLNLKLLFGDEGYAIPTIMGTAYGMSENAKGWVRSYLARNVKYGRDNPSAREEKLAGVDFKNDQHVSDIALADLTCSQLLQRNRQIFRPT